MAQDKELDKRKAAIRVRVSKLIKAAEKNKTPLGTPKEIAAFYYNHYYTEDEETLQALVKRLTKGYKSEQLVEFGEWGDTSETLSEYRPTMYAAQEAVLRTASEYNMIAYRVETRIKEAQLLADLFKDLQERASVTPEQLEKLPLSKYGVIRYGKRPTSHSFTVDSSFTIVTPLTDKEDVNLRKAKEDYIKAVKEAKGIFNAMYEFLDFYEARVFLTDEIKTIVEKTETATQLYNFHYWEEDVKLPQYSEIEPMDYSGTANPFINTYCVIRRR